MSTGTETWSCRCSTSSTCGPESRSSIWAAATAGRRDCSPGARRASARSASTSRRRWSARAEELHSLTIRARYEIAPFERAAFKDRRFDRAFSMEALYYAVDLDGALSELFRVLKAARCATVVVDYYVESPATAIWKQCTGVPMHYLSQAQMARGLRARGLPGGWHPAGDRFARPGQT